VRGNRGGDQKRRLAGALAEPAAGLEPAKPSLQVRYLQGFLLEIRRLDADDSN
jgi:hypothetical protein